VIDYAGINDVGLVAHVRTDSGALRCMCGRRRRLAPLGGMEAL